jgi:hypothetical protein
MTQLGAVTCMSFANVCLATGKGEIVSSAESIGKRCHLRKTGKKGKFRGQIQFNFEG